VLHKQKRKQVCTITSLIISNFYMLVSALRRSVSVSGGRVGLTIRGAHTNVRRGPFSHTRSQDFLWGALLAKKLTIFLDFVVTFKPNVETAW